MNYYIKNDYSKIIQATAIAFGLCTLLYMSNDNNYRTKEQNRSTSVKNNIEAILVHEEELFKNNRHIKILPKNNPLKPQII